VFVHLVAVAESKGAIEYDTDDAVSAAARTDSEAFAVLYDRYCASVLRYLWALLGDRAEAEDVTSAVFLRTLDRIGSFHPGRGSFASWLFTIARNAARDHVRKQSRAPVIYRLQEGDPDPQQQPDKTALDTELRAAVWRAYGRLTDEQRDAVSLRYLAGLPFVDVARVMHKSEPATKMLVRRGIEGLRRGLAEEGYDARQ
jgi:RNA polymerase sigma-70 factor (ECF subfamily)